MPSYNSPGLKVFVLLSHPSVLVSHLWPGIFLDPLSFLQKVADVQYVPLHLGRVWMCQHSAIYFSPRICPKQMPLPPIAGIKEGLLNPERPQKPRESALKKETEVDPVWEILTLLGRTRNREKPRPWQERWPLMERSGNRTRDRKTRNCEVGK